MTACGSGQRLHKARHRNDHPVDKAERENAKHGNHHTEEDRVLELDSPADRPAGQTKRRQPGGKKKEARDNACGAGEKAQSQLPSRRARRDEHRRQLQRKDRQHAWHQVQDQTPDEGNRHDPQ